MLNRIQNQYLFGFSRAAADLDRDPQGTLKKIDKTSFESSAMRNGYKDGLIAAVNYRLYVSKCIQCSKLTENTVYCSMPCAEQWYYDNRSCEIEIYCPRSGMGQ